MEILYVVTADYASVSLDQKVSINGIFTEMAAALLPVVHAQMYVVAAYRVPPDELDRTFETSIDFMDGAGLVQRVHQEEHQIDPSQIVSHARPAYFNQIVSVTGLVLGVYGQHRFRVRVAGGQTKDATFFVVPIGQQAQRRPE